LGLVHINRRICLSCLIHRLILWVLLRLNLEAFLLFLELVQELATLSEELLSRQLSVFEFLHFLLAHIALSLPLCI
jgi:hypothetical protein